MDHLLIHFKFSHTLWSKVFRVFGIQWVMLKIMALFCLHGGISLDKICQIPGIWFQHVLCSKFGSHTFEDKERFVDLLRSLLLGTLFQWACIWDFTQCISISTFLRFATFSS